MPVFRHNNPQDAAFEQPFVTTNWYRVADGTTLHPLQSGFWEMHGLQCGFCTPGMIMSAKALLAKNPNPTEEEVRYGLEGNLCRCTGYHNIVKSVLAAAATANSNGGK